MELLDSFVAGALLQRIRRSGGDRPPPACASFSGAVLFADISSYTTLAEAMCRQGADGIERLGRILDRAFRDSLQAVHDTGGEVACFAGDAFVAYWPAEDGNTTAAKWQAEECARALHAAGRTATASASESAPALHIGLASGELWAALLGAEGRWHVLLAGEAVRNACAAAGRAGPGETIPAQSDERLTVSSLGASASGAGASTVGGVVLTPPEIVGQVPRRIQEYLTEGYSAWIPQRRTICALFARIDGLDNRAPVLSHHQAVVTSLHTALRPYTGSSGTLLLDDKGLIFTLCLGMPDDAHADYALRAIRAGLAIRTELEKLGVTCAIGVASGPAICAAVGVPQRRHYWAVGRFMHVAARLMQAAGTGMLCTDDVADRVRRFVTLSPERSIALKGVAWPVRPFRVRDAAADDVERLFGREDEQATLDGYLDGFENGRGTVLSLVGDAGLGKTVLVHYVQQSAARRQVTCLTGGAGSVGSAGAYASWRPVFTALLAAMPSASEASQSERLARLGTIRHPEFASLINAVVPGFLDEASSVRSLTGQARADATSGVLSDVIGARLTGRFVLVLEDCHWMDSASWRLMLRVAQDHPQALIVLTSRPATDSQELSALRRLDHFVEMKLQPLRSSAIESIARHLLGERSTSAELMADITRRAVGNPLFAREYALLLSTSAPTEAESGSVDSPPIRRETVPVTVQSLIASRLDALPPAEDLVLKTASVIGDRFGVDLVAAAYARIGRGSALDILTNLAERHLLVREGADTRSFAFQHAIIREVTYQQLTGEQRRDLHRHVAEAIEGQYRSDLRPYFATLAHHWSDAGVATATLKYSDQAASQALAAGAFREAERLLSSCIDLVTHEPHLVPAADRIRWHRQLADARQGMGQLEPRSAAALHALRIAGCSRPHTATGLIAQATLRLGDMAWRAIRRGPLLPAESSLTLEIARAYRHNAEVCYFNNDPIGMLCDSLSAVAYASRLTPTAVLAGASTELGGMLSFAGLRRRGERLLQRTIETAEAADDHAAQAYAHMINCLYYIGRGEWESAEKSVQRCQDLCEPMDDRVNWTNAQAVRFWMSYHRSNDAAAAAADAARQLRDRASETGNRQHQAWALRCLALCALRRGEAAEAIRHVRGALEALGETAAINERIPTLGILALAQLRDSQAWSARATAKEALPQLARVRRPLGHGSLEGYSGLTAVALDGWREERSPDWQRAVKECLRVLRRYRSSFAIGEPRYYLYLGDYRRLSGSLAAARRSYRRGKAAAIRRGMRWDADRCSEALEDLSPRSTV